MPVVPYRDPFDWFESWFEEVRGAGLPEPTAMALATVDERGQPSVRIVLLKEYDRKGFVFYTNGRSRKGHELSNTPRAALNFFWPQLNRQVRVEGRVEAVSDEHADDYFATRARESQLGAWASLQSETLASRAELMARVAEFEARYEGQAVPRPPHWGGFRVVPERIEFWAEGDFRLHDRWEFRREGEGEDWQIRRLYP